MKEHENKLLTIVIPTYNRSEMLEYTMGLMVEQLIRNVEDVDVCICDNASTDSTADVVNNLQSSGLGVKYIRYEDHVPIGDSITRSVENVKTPYFQLWSDDDIPSPMMVDMIVDTIKRYPNIGTISFNRINGNGVSERFDYLYNLRVFNSEFKQYIHYYESSQEYAEDRFSEVDFVSINVISLIVWKKGMQIYSKEHLGFQFVAPLLYGVKGCPCIYIDYPLCIKRDPPIEQIEYADKWPLYAYIGMPRILCKLQELGVIHNAKQSFKKYRYNIDKHEYINNIITFCYPNKELYAPYLQELLSYQEGKSRIIMTKAIMWPKSCKTLLTYIYRKLVKFNLF